MKFDTDWYLRTYPDVAAGLRNGDIASAFEHFVRFGRREGRRPHPLSKRFIIHVGPHKTGSTYLQAEFEGLRDKLQRRGILYPKNWTTPGGSPGHHQLPARLRRGDLNETQQELSEIIEADCHTVLLSAEDLVGLSGAELEKLRYAMDTDRIHIVLYVRRWPEWLMSCWKETVRHGEVRSLPEILVRHTSAPESSEHINLSFVIRKFSDVFGRRSIKLVSYSHLVETNTNILTHFLNIIVGISIDQLPAAKAVHVSANDGETEVARALNCIEPGLGLTFLLRIDKNIGADLLQDLQEYRLEMTIDSGSQTWDRFENEMFMQYGDLIVPPRPVDRFYVRKSSTISYIDGRYAAAAAIRQRLQTLVGQLKSYDSM